MRECDVYAERDSRGECDRCYCTPPVLYRLGCECGAFDADEGAYRYCSTCVRHEMRRHDPVGAR
jgi:hypothetical protein